MIPFVPLHTTVMQCEYLVNPMGVDVARPHLSWQLGGSRRGEQQTGWQVIAASDRQRLTVTRADLWNSQKVAGDQQLGVTYAGVALKPGQRVWWKLRVWDREGKPSKWSQPAWWEMGKLANKNWSGKWIEDTRPTPTKPEEFYQDQPAPLFRHEFSINKPVSRARVYVTGLGYYELHLNGKRMGDRQLDPAWTAYAKRVPYATYDVTAQLKQGPNAVGAIVGNGWYNLPPMLMFGRFNFREHLTSGFPRLIMDLDIEYTDGTRQTIATDNTWKVSDSPILRNFIYLGEKYDARIKVAGWDKPGYDDSAWRAVKSSTKPLGKLEAQLLPPVRVTRIVHPIAVTEPKPGVYVVDMGQNFAGRIRLKLRASSGDTIVTRFGELTHPDGTLDYRTTCCTQIKKNMANGGPGAPEEAIQSDTYIARGGGVEQWEPRFVWHGFRYVEITGLTAKPELSDIEGHRMNSDVTPVSQFTCSDPLLNRIHEIVHWTLLSNMFSVQSDCPARERLGYGGDIVGTSEMAMLNMDMSQFYAKAVRDLADSVRPNGGFTEVSPDVGINDSGLGEGTGPISWGIAHPMLVWQMYQYYGDRALLVEQYPYSKRYADFLESKSTDDILEFDISDHNMLEQRPYALTSTAGYYYATKLVAQMAAVLGKRADAKHYTEMAQRIKNAYNNKFYDAKTGKYGTGIQTSQVVSMYHGLTPDGSGDAALNALVHNVRAKDDHLTTGIMGTKYLLDVLSQQDYFLLAYNIATQKTFPGYGYMLANGATTLWEEWPGGDNVPSHNHPMFGSVDEWMIKHVGGIAPAEHAVGCNRVVIAPKISQALTSATTRFNTVRGEVACTWKRTDASYVVDLVVPVGVTAEVHLPGDIAGITEGGQPLATAPGITLTHNTIVVGGGVYRFAGTL